MRGQKAIEYMLFIGAAVMIALIAVVFISPQFTQSSDKLINYTNFLENYSIAPSGSTASPQASASVQAIRHFSTISGFVKDNSGNPIEGAAVKPELNSQPLGTVFSDYSGFYSIEVTSNGNYVLEASKNGFAAQQAIVSVSIGSDYPQDFALSRV